MAKLPTIPVLHIYHSQDAELYSATIREDKVYLKHDKVAQFSNKGVFTIKDRRGRKAKKFKAVIYLDGKACCASVPQKEAEWAQEHGKLTDAQEANSKNPHKLQVIPDTEEMIFEPLTDMDRKTVVKREIAKQLGKFKPLETWQFAVIIGLIGAVLALEVIRMI